ncbi:hypothetical protein BDR03DRAFT_656881 [Suillus americanus]|nr:hypothetical protein BDR03DRAFT_656881 [Suillus americanus]
MLSPFPIFLKSAAAASSSSTTTAMNDNCDNLSDIIDLFPYTVTSTYEPPPGRPPRNPDRLKNESIPRRAPPRFPPPTSPLPPLPPDPVTPSQQLNKLPQPMYPTPGGLSPWSAPLYQSKPTPKAPPSSPPQSTFILRGPVGVLPLSRAVPGASTTKSRRQLLPFRCRPRAQRPWRNRYLG